MSTPHAVYTIAHERGIDLLKHLGNEETAEVRRLLTELRAAGHPAPAADNSKQRAKRPAAKQDVKVSIAGVDVGTIPALSPTHARDAKRMSERVYPTLYVFENSVRDLIERVLAAAYGKDWWETAVPGAVHQTAEKHKKDEQKDPWHSPRGRRPIDYVLLTDLWAIIKHRWADFKLLFPDQAWVQSLITNDMNVSRRVLAHMNALPADDVSNIEAAFRKWAKQLQAVEREVP
ncbi:MAG TPA: Swt1 family HEPN domain-containing protein [Solirubrobacteraceae bacterium]|nr:Swt1 family HEPN domain-containing protein [Solirubrobacteraceae bacterium]